jgi:methionyl aminopeptidase
MTISATLNLNSIIHSGKILASALNLSKNLITVGISPLEIDTEIEKSIKRNGGVPSFLGYNGFPNSSCISINEQIVHGVPSTEPLQEGDLVTIDIGVSYENHCTDAARTFYIGSCIDERKKSLLSTVERALNNGILFSVSGNHVGDISYAIQKVIEINGYKTPLEIGGHGVGTVPHQPPFIPNYGVKGSGMELVYGMCLAIEPIVIDGSNKLALDSANGWSIYSPDGCLSVHIEDTIVVTDKEPLILTRNTLEGGVV